MTLKKQKPKQTDNKTKILKNVEKSVKEFKRVANSVKSASPVAIKNTKEYINKTKSKIKTFNIKKSLSDIFYMLRHPIKYFSSIVSDNNFEDAIAKILLYGIITAGIDILFSIHSITLWNAILSLITLPIISALITFSLAGIILLFSYLTKGQMNFEIAVKSVASCIFMYPLSCVLYELSFSYYLLFVFSIILDLYTGFLIYSAVTFCLKGEKRIANIIFGIFAVLIIAFHFSSSSMFYLGIKNPKVVFTHSLNGIKNLNITDL